MSFATHRAVELARRGARGFTLIEMAVVLLVVALILGSILVPLNAQVRQRNVAETQRALEEIRLALIGYAMIHGHLPQPAKSASDGAERTDPLTLCTDLQPNNCTGFIPWTALGTPRGDAWGKLIRYSVNPYYAGNGTGAAIAVTQFTSTAGQRSVKSRDPGGAEFDLATNVPAVVVSHGARNLGTSVEGANIADNPSTSPNANDDEDANAAAGATTFWSRNSSDNATSAGGEFDDIVVWIPPAVLFSQLVAAGKLP